MKKLVLLGIMVAATSALAATRGVVPELFTATW